jgi:hypothetical protein
MYYVKLPLLKNQKPNFREKKEGGSGAQGSEARPESTLMNEGTLGSYCISCYRADNLQKPLDQLGADKVAAKVVF